VACRPLNPQRASIAAHADRLREQRTYEAHDEEHHITRVSDLELEVRFGRREEEHERAGAR
jgi:hypothetical protein